MGADPLQSRLHTIASHVSAHRLAVAFVSCVLVLWWLTCVCPIRLSLPLRWFRLNLVSEQGSITFYRAKPSSPEPYPSFFRHWQPDWPMWERHCIPRVGSTASPGAVLQGMRPRPGRVVYPTYRIVYMSVPYPLILLLSVVALLMRRWLACRADRKRRAAGLCSHCGYDLRATPQRCPECGAFAEGRLA